MPVPTRRDVFALAWPIIIANAATPLLGLVDVAVIGNVGTTADLAAIALGSLVLTFVYWLFGFLRMGTTGFVAQAAGAGNEAEVRASLARALLLAGVIGAALLLLQGPIATAAFFVLDASPGVESVARDYYAIRIWGAPASLARFAVVGVLIGLGLSRQLLGLQVLLNGLNIALDAVLAGALGWGVAGIAWGTVISEWLTLVVGVILVFTVLRQREREARPFISWNRLVDPASLMQTLAANRDIMIRTLLLLCGFGLFTRAGAQFGDDVLAANHVLLQFVSFSAFFLDGFAHVAEALVGQALGKRRLADLDVAVRRTTEQAAVTALALGLVILAAGRPLVGALADLPEVVELAGAYRYHAALYVTLSFAAFQLDGIFIGATRGRDMRNAALVSFLVFGMVWWSLSPLGNHGLWVAFIIYVVARAATLAVRYPALRRAASAVPDEKP